MSYSVRAIPAFWDAVDDVADANTLQELYDICFEMVETGPELPGADPATIPLPPLVLPGWFLDLPSQRAFIGYTSPGENRVLLISLTLYDWD